MLRAFNACLVVAVLCAAYVLYSLEHSIRGVMQPCCQWTLAGEEWQGSSWQGLGRQRPGLAGAPDPAAGSARLDAGAPLPRPRRCGGRLPDAHHGRGAGPDADRSRPGRINLSEAPSLR